MSYEAVLRDLAENDERIVVMTAENRAAIRNLPPVLGKRFIDVGICEQTMIGVAAGLSLRGRRPVCHALATFITLRAFEFSRDDLGIPNLPAVLVGGVPGFLSDANGPTHQAIDDVALMRTIPNVRVVCPADEHELADALPELITQGSPCYVRHIGLKPAFEHKKSFELGKAEVLKDGDEIGILTYGLLTREAYAAANLLEQQGHSVRLVHLSSLKPIDETAVFETLARCRTTFTVEDHLLTGGLFSIVAELCARRGKAPGRLVPFALEERWFLPTLLKGVLEHEGFSAEKLAERITRAIAS
ncbi:MAG: transketolase [Polyangiaceae bacterium]|nr:transketolase [Polyangiaceae bacterium]